MNRADSLVGKVVNGENIRELIGNVMFSQGKVVVNCDRAIQNFKTNKIQLTGNVIVRDDSSTLYGKRGIYHSNDKVSEAFDGVQIEEGTQKLSADYAKYFIDERKIYFNGNVLVQDTATRLVSDELTYFRTDKKTIAVSNVKISQFKNNMIVYGNYFENFNKRSFITNSPRLVQIDTAKDGSSDTLIIVSKEIHSFQDTVESFLAIDNVIIKRGTVTSESGTAVYYTDYDSIILRNKPFIWYDQTQVSGDSIFIKLQNRKLDKVYVVGNAFAISRSDSILRNRFDQMSGENITMTFSEDKIQNITVDVTATSLYYLYEESLDESSTTLRSTTLSSRRLVEVDRPVGSRRPSAKDSTIILRSPNGLNRTTGDQIIISFIDKSVDKIKIIGGVEGVYVPENIVRGKEADYNLAGFNWREVKPALPPNPFAELQRTILNK
ncbi:MAG: OstA-like protein [Bacteroidota bacterium]|nr:OstA-like protein [Bacteroidota bacterium]